MVDEMIMAFSKNNEDIPLDDILAIEIKIADCLIIKIPEHFSQLTDEEAKKRYASESRPEIIYSDITGSVNFAFNLLHNQVLDLPVYLSKFIASITLLYPQTLVYDENMLVSAHEGHDIRYVEFRTSSLEGPIYNIMYLLSNGKETLMGTFNCPFEEYLKWRVIAFRMIETILF